MADKEKTKVTRISASDDTPVTKPVKSSKKPEGAKAVKPVKTKKKRSFGVLGKIGGYFKGAWSELRQVVWPNRRATWGLTAAVLLFSAFFVVLITALDAGFKFLFEQILQ